MWAINSDSSVHEEEGSLQNYAEHKEEDMSLSQILVLLLVILNLPK